jgi:hypothetical protein
MVRSNASWRNHLLIKAEKIARAHVKFTNTTSGKCNYLLRLAPTFRDPPWGSEGSQTLPYHFTILRHPPGSSQCTCELSTITQEHLTAFIPLPGRSTNLLCHVLCSACLPDAPQPSLPIGIICDSIRRSCCQFIAATSSIVTRDLYK